MKTPATAPVAVILTVIFTAWKADARVPAMYVFGDSITDVGNNNYLPGTPATKADRPYFGIDYPCRKPTGRFSNGYNTIDFLAMMAGFKESPPPFLSVKNASQEKRGVNFGSGGSGILDTTNPNVSLSMDTQISYFRKSVLRLAAAKGDSAAQFMLRKSLFIFSTGSNDLLISYLTYGPRNSTEKDKFISFLTNQYKEQLKVLYGLGARKFAVIGSALPGCSPAFRLINPTATGDCVEEINGLSWRFSKAMIEKLRSLSLVSRGMKYSYLNTNEVATILLANPLKFGFKEVNSACCGSGRFNAATPCFINSTLCSNRDEYLMFDQSHPTQATYKLFAEYAYNGSSKYVVPTNFKTLF